MEKNTMTTDLREMKKRLSDHQVAKRLVRRTLAIFAVYAIVTMLLPMGSAYAQGTQVPDPTIPINTIWTLVAAFLVFFMQAGFLALEAGASRPRETVNLLLEDFIDVALTGFVFYLFGFAFMFGDGNSFIGTKGFALTGLGGWDSTYVSAGYDFGVPLGAFWLFQFAFASTAATIASGAMIGRTGFWANLAYTALVSGVIYPIVGHWLWHPQGWLATRGALDFAGSTVVHTMGAMVAITGVITLGPRLGRKFANEGGGPMIYHNYTLIALGTLILWFGWFGFNPGSTLSGMNTSAISLIAFNTNLAGCTGALAAMFLYWFQSKKWDLAYSCNGCLAGLVAITAPCAFVSPVSAAIIGAVGGVLVVLVIQAEEVLHLDDVVTAFPVHGANGIWGTLSIGLFAQKSYQFTLAESARVDGLFLGGGFDQLGTQLLASASAVAFGFGIFFVFFMVLKYFGVLRVPASVEIEGVDLVLHGTPAYPGTIMDTNDGTPTSIEAIGKAGVSRATAAAD
jgi:Amt family ammonium transporter